MPILKVDDLVKLFTSGIWPFKTPQTYTAVNNITFVFKKVKSLDFLDQMVQAKQPLFRCFWEPYCPRADRSVTWHRLLNTDCSTQKNRLCKWLRQTSCSINRN